MYIVIRKQPQVIKLEYDIPLPYSHWFTGDNPRLQALKWMAERGLQSICWVVDREKYIRLGGI